MLGEYARDRKIMKQANQWVSLSDKNVGDKENQGRQGIPSPYPHKVTPYKELLIAWRQVWHPMPMMRCEMRLSEVCHR
jgi:hypothetical protein